MPRVSCIVGGMYGSEGKGAICGYLADEFDIAVRVGAPNAGHTLKMGDNIWKLQQIPVAGLVNPDCVLLIGAAGLINMSVLKREMEYIKDLHGRFYIDRNAGILTEEHRKQEEKEKMFEGIGSTCEGVGVALRDKIQRKTFVTAKDVPELQPFIINVAEYINKQPSSTNVMIEGTQGYALSLNHGPYPFCTSRDIIASSLLSDVGLAPSICEDVTMVIRTYPIRVAGNSGPMCGKELTWAKITARSGAPALLVEKTTVTKRIRRVCEFSLDLVKEATEANRPSQIALTFIDYLDYTDYGKTKFKDLSPASRAWIDMIEGSLRVPITLIKTGPEFEHMIDRRAEYDTKNV